jgi:subtilisin family serine protease
VIYYHVHADATDSDGHGTLVSGTAAGKCENDAQISAALKEEQASGGAASLGEDNTLCSQTTLLCAMLYVWYDFHVFL